MRSRTKTAAAFMAGLVVGSLLAATAVSFRWGREYGRWHALQVADQANVATEIYAGRSEELAGRILESLPQYVEDMDQAYRAPESADMVSRLVAAAYRESGEPMPAAVRRILERWEDAGR